MHSVKGGVKYRGGRTSNLVKWSAYVHFLPYCSISDVSNQRSADLNNLILYPTSITCYSVTYNFLLRAKIEVDIPYTAGELERPRQAYAWKIPRMFTVFKARLAHS